MNDTAFRQLVFDFYLSHPRPLPWRETGDPYSILVSEIMLQQTQAERVVPKYLAFLESFPDAKTLAAAEQVDLLRMWQGLGYNRRALNLQRAAQAIVTDFGGGMPQTRKELESLPGVGPYTAGAVLAFAFNQPITMIETNIRRAYIHHSFSDRDDISDTELFPLIERTVDQENPREWYYALMDYGNWLGRQLPNPNRRSKHYAKQSTFQGSHRQLRGAIVRLITKGETNIAAIVEETGRSLTEIQTALRNLEKEGFVLPPSLSIGA